MYKYLLYLFHFFLVISGFSKKCKGSHHFPQVWQKSVCSCTNPSIEGNPKKRARKWNFYCYHEDDDDDDDGDGDYDDHDNNDANKTKKLVFRQRHDHLSTSFVEIG